MTTTTQQPSNSIEAYSGMPGGITTLMFIAAAYCDQCGDNLSALFKKTYPEDQNNPLLDAHWRDYFAVVAQEAEVPEMSEASITTLSAELIRHHWGPLANAVKRTWQLWRARELWREFADVPINNADEIEIPFHGFAAGTERFEVWRWFEEAFGCSIAIDLMGQGGEA